MSTSVADLEVQSMTSLMGRYFAGVALTLCVYDWLILIERESQTVWKVRWTGVKSVYYLNRGLSLVGLTLTVIQTTNLWTHPLSEKFCKIYLWIGPILQLLTSYLSNIILTLRVVALYSRQLLIPRILYVLLVLNCLVTIIPTIHSVYLWTLDVNYVPLLHLCISPVYSPSSPAIFISAAVFEGILFSFTLYRAILDYRNGVLTGYTSSRLLFILYRDGFYYFAVLGVVHAWNALEYFVAPLSGMFMAVYFTWGMMTTMSSRVYLNLILAAHGGEGDDVTTGGFSTLHVGRANRTKGTDREPGEIVTFGSKSTNRPIPFKTFATSVLSAESNTQPGAKPDYEH